MEDITKKRFEKIRKVIIAGLMALFLLLLGLFGGVAYRVHALDEKAFETHSNWGYADARFYVDILYNPLLYPLYWLLGSGHFNGTVRIKYVPEGYYPGEFGGPIWGLKPQDRYDSYVLHMLTWGSLLNLFFLFIVTAATEIVGKRRIYIVFFSGILGFFAWELLGVIIGMIIGVLIVLLLFKFWGDNPFVSYWDSIWIDDRSTLT